MDIKNLTFTHQKTITPDNSVFKGPVYVMVMGSPGNVEVETAGGEHQVWALEKKEVLPIMVRRVFSALTTASGITILYND